MEISATTAPAAATDVPHAAPPASQPNANVRAALQGLVSGNSQPLIQTETALLRTLLQALQSSSGGLSQVTSLLTDLERASTLPATPANIRQEISQTLAAAAPLRNLGSESAILKALTEAPSPVNAGTGPATTAPATVPPPLVTELKGALASLQQATQQWAASSPATTSTPATGAPSPAASQIVAPWQPTPANPGMSSDMQARAVSPVPAGTTETEAIPAPVQGGTKAASEIPPTLYPLGALSVPVTAGGTSPVMAKGGMADAMVSLLLSQQAMATPSDALLRSRNGRPPPPLTDGPEYPHGSTNPALQAYRKAQPATPVQAATPWPQDPGAPFIVRTIAARTEAALNQIRLLETAAQLNRAEQASAGAPAAVEPRWTFDLPLQTPYGEARARFEVARDGVRTRNGAHAVVWRARFSMDLEPLGPVHAQIALMGKHAWVSLWAEREASMSLLEQQQAALRNAFSADSVEAEVICCLGKPPARPAGSGAVWDGEV